MITITSSASHVIVDMGAYYPVPLSVRKGYWRKDQIKIITLNTDHIEIEAADGRDWLLDFDGNSITSAFTVSSVNGVPPISNEDLFDKLVSILS